MHKSFLFLGTVTLLTRSAMTSGQMEENSRTLVINDQSGKVALMQVWDRTYVDLKSMARIVHGSISYGRNRIQLDVPCTSAGAAVKAAESEQPTSVGLSREFVRVGIEEISLMREWASTLTNAVQNGYPITESWPPVTELKRRVALRSHRQRCRQMRIGPHFSCYARIREPAGLEQQAAGRAQIDGRGELFAFA